MFKTVIISVSILISVFAENLNAENRWLTFKEPTPWGTQLEVMVDPELDQQFIVEVENRVNTERHRIEVVFTWRQPFDGSVREESALTEKILKYLRNNLDVSMMDMDYKGWNGEDITHIIYADQAMILPTGKKMITIRGIFSIQDEIIKLTVIGLRG